MCNMYRQYLIWSGPYILVISACVLSSSDNISVSVADKNICCDKMPVLEKSKNWLLCWLLFPLPVCQIVISKKLLSVLHPVSTCPPLSVCPSAASHSVGLAEQKGVEQHWIDVLKAEGDRSFLNSHLIGQAQRSQSHRSAEVSILERHTLQSYQAKESKSQKERN